MPNTVEMMFEKARRTTNVLGVHPPLYRFGKRLVMTGLKRSRVAQRNCFKPPSTISSRIYVEIYTEVEA